MFGLAVMTLIKWLALLIFSGSRSFSDEEQPRASVATSKDEHIASGRAGIWCSPAESGVGERASLSWLSV